MAQGEGSNVGKIVIIILGVLGVLGVICCGGGWLLVGDQVKMGFNVGMAFPRMIEDLTAQLGPGVVVLPKEDEQGRPVFVVGVGPDEDLEDPARVAEIQDLAWRSYAEAFKDGALPVRGLAVGRTTTVDGKQNVVDWRENVVTLDELAERTGVAAPPVAEGLPSEGVQVEYKGDDE